MLSSKREQNLRFRSTRTTGHLTIGITKYRIYSYAPSRDIISTVSRTDGLHLKPLQIFIIFPNSSQTQIQHQIA